MTTINGVEFNMVNLRPVAVHRNATSEQPGSDTNFITDMGYDGLVLRLEGFETTLATYDSVISEFMKTGEQTLVHRTGWQFSVYSAQLSLDLIEGFADNYFPYDLILKTSTPYRESTTLSCRAKVITANNQEWSAEDMPCDNLLDNWSFEDWSAGVSSAPDGWVFAGNSIDREDTEIKIGTYSVKLTNSGSATYIYDSIPNHLNYRGIPTALGMWVKTSTADVARVLIADGVLNANSPYHTGSGDWEWLEINKTIDLTNDRLRLYCRCEAAGVAYFDGSVFIEGDSIPDNTFIRDIDTDGSVDAVPDIQVTGGKSETYLSSNPVGEPSFETIAGWTFAELDTNTKISGEQGDIPYAGTYTYKISILTGSQIGDYGQISRTVDFTTIDELSVMIILFGGLNRGDFKILVDGDELGSWGDMGGSLYYKKSVDTSSYTGSLTLTLKYVVSVTDASIFVRFDDIRTYKYLSTNVQVYNTEDNTVKCDVANEILDTAVHRINVDGTGTVVYDDYFTTNKYLAANDGIANVTHDTGDDELDIADDGYIYYKVDTKYIITGIPLLTSRINITTATPTIQISTDAATWYDISTAIVDDVETVYELDSSSLHLNAKTAFYFRFDCVKLIPTTCSIKYFELDINIVTIDVEHPVITTGGSASTFRFDQDAEGESDCTVALIYRDRSWPA